MWGGGGGSEPRTGIIYIYIYLHIHTLYMFMFVSGSFFHFATQVQDVDGSCCGRYRSRRAQRFKLRSAQWNCAQVPAVWDILGWMKMHTAKKINGVKTLPDLVGWLGWNLNSSYGEITPVTVPVPVFFHPSYQFICKAI